MILWLLCLAVLAYHLYWRAAEVMPRLDAGAVVVAVVVVVGAALAWLRHDVIHTVDQELGPVDPEGDE